MDNIVIGSGLAGMSIALLLAQQNQPVTIFEAMPAPAPLMQGFKRSSLFFDTGFHYAGGLRPNGVLYRWLNALDVWKYIGDSAIQSVTEEFHFSSKEIYFFPPEEKLLLSSLSKQFQEIAGFETFLSTMKEILSLSPYMNPLQKDPIYNIAGNNTSIADVLAPLTFSPILKKMLMARCLLLGLHPNDTAFEHYSLLSVPYFESCTSVVGGGKKISDAFLHALEDAGITVQCNMTLQSLLVEEGNLQGIHLTNGKKISCERCFFTGHPQQLQSIIPQKILRPAFFTHIEEMPETPLAFMLFGETMSDTAQNKVICLLAQEGTALNTLDHDEPSVYVSIGEPVDGRYPLLAIASIAQDTYTKNDPAYASWKQNYAEKLAKYLEKRLPELAPIRILDAATPATLRHWVYGSTGSLYGIAHTNETLPLLPITRLEGFFMAGQNILLPGVLGAIVSAAVCTSFALGRDKILQKFRQ